LKKNQDFPISDLEFCAEMPGSQEKYGVAVLPHPGHPFPPICQGGYPVKKQFRVDCEWGEAPPQPQNKTGTVVNVPLKVGNFSIDGRFDVAELEEPDWGNAFLGNHWGLEYILFSHEVVLRFDLRILDAEQICSRVVEQFLPQKNFSLAPSSKRTVSSGQTVPDLGWKEGFQGLPKWTGPVNAPRVILDPHTPGIVHVIFDLTQPKLHQWEAAKRWLARIQADTVGQIKKRRASGPAPKTWLRYLRILDAWDFNPDPEKLHIIYETIGEMVLWNPDDPNRDGSFRARVKQDHDQAKRLLAYFPC